MFKRLLSKRNSTGPGTHASNASSGSQASSSSPAHPGPPQVIYVQHPPTAPEIYPSSDSKHAAPQPAPPAYGSGGTEAASSSLSPLTAPPASIAPAAGGSRTSLGGEDPFDFLKEYDTCFLVDNSGSMAGSRWTQTRDALASVVATAAKYDDDGVDLHWLNNEKPSIGLKSASQVMALFGRVRPSGGTPTGKRLEALLNEHISLLERAQKTGGPQPKPLNIVVLTDGEPTDDPRSVIIAAAKRLDRGNFSLSAVGIFFLQIGNDPAATEALAELDDDLGADIRDIVDTAPYVPGSGPPPKGWIEKVLMGGVNRRLDRKAAPVAVR